jgi:hypothetical protein
LGFVKLLEGREPEDVFPTHYRMNDPGAIAKVATAAGFEVERMELVSTSAITVMLGPLVVPELLWIRLLRQPRFAWLRSDIVCTLRRR